MCKVLEVSPSGYYAWRKRPQSATAQRRRRLTVIIKAIHQQSRQNYGSPRVYEELQARGESCNVKTVARIMRENDIVAKRRRKFKVTTDSNHRLPVAENLLDRQFTVTAPNRVWVCDITYIPTWEGWLYLATVQDLFSRKIVGWSMQPRMTRQLVIDALEMAVDRRRPLRHGRGRRDRWALLPVRGDRSPAGHASQMAATSRRGRRVPQHRTGRLRGRRPGPPRAQGRPGRALLPPRRSRLCS